MFCTSLCKFNNIPAQKSCINSLKLTVWLVSVHLISGNYELPTLHKPSVVGFGWPPLLVNVSMLTIPFHGTVQYDLLYNRTCPWHSETDCSSENLSIVTSCHRKETQTSLHIKRLSCVICNSTKKCKTMGISQDHDLCIYFKVTTPSGCRHVCKEVNYIDIIMIPPPKLLRLLPTKRNELTVHWKRPPELTVSYIISYQVLLKLPDHQPSSCIMKLLRPGNHNYSYTFTGLNTWTNYSVTICCEFYGRTADTNKTTCSCGGHRYAQGWPVFQRTLPEEPSKQPLLEPCEASCRNRNFRVVLKWKTSEGHKWNGIPTKSVITLWRNVSQDHDQLGTPVVSSSVPLAADYNGSLVTYTMHNLSTHVSYLVKVQYCSQAGCGPNATRTLSCDKCELLIEPGTLPGKHFPSNTPDSNWTILVSVVVCVVTVLVLLAAFLCHRTKKKRLDEQRNRAPLQENIGDVTPSGIYEQPPSFSDFASDSGDYGRIDMTDTRSLLTDGNQAPELV